jgi:predicted RNase H-like HicB family nuclease
MKVYDFKVLLEPDEETGGYVVSCPSLPGCYTQGDTIDEALENIKEAILLCLEDIQAQKRTVLQRECRERANGTNPIGNGRTTLVKFAPSCYS